MCVKNLLKAFDIFSPPFIKGDLGGFSRPLPPGREETPGEIHKDATVADSSFLGYRLGMTS
jgi:hypothetical protein